MAICRQGGVAAGVVIAYAKVCTQWACQHSCAFRVAGTLNPTRGQPRPESVQLIGVVVIAVPALPCFSGCP
eukprot:9018741-Lingulodinium_polyedra.AAC.1